MPRRRWRTPAITDYNDWGTQIQNRKLMERLEGRVCMFCHLDATPRFVPTGDCVPLCPDCTAGIGKTLKTQAAFEKQRTISCRGWLERNHLAVRDKVKVPAVPGDPPKTDPARAP